MSMYSFNVTGGISDFQWRWKSSDLRYFRLLDFWWPKTELVRVSAKWKTWVEFLNLYSTCLCPDFESLFRRLLKLALRPKRILHVIAQRNELWGLTVASSDRPLARISAFKSGGSATNPYLPWASDPHLMRTALSEERSCLVCVALTSVGLTNMPSPIRLRARLP